MAQDAHYPQLLLHYYPKKKIYSFKLLNHANLSIGIVETML